MTVFSEETFVAMYDHEADDAWRQQWVKHAEPDEWPSLLLPTLAGRPVPQDNTIRQGLGSRQIYSQQTARVGCRWVCGGLGNGEWKRSRSGLDWVDDAEQY